MTSTTDPANGAEFSTEELELLSYLLEEETVGHGRGEGIPRRGKLERVPLSFAQERLWFLDQLDPDSTAYHISTTLRLSGELNVGALEQSLNEIVRRHEALRTTFSAIDGRPVQVIAPTLTLALPVIDLQELSEAEREAEARRLVAKELGRPLNLAEGPLLRTMLLRLDKDNHILLLKMHHIVSDGWSMGILRREMSTLYDTFCMGKPSPLPDLPLQYADYAVWQRGWLEGEALEEQLGYWRQELDGAPRLLALLTDRPRPPIQTYRGKARSLVLPEHLSEELKALSRRESATLYMTLLAAFQTLLYRYSGQDSICVGTPIANRHRSEVEGLIGFFVNTLVMRGDLSGNLTFRELLGRIREAALGAYANQDVPFERVVEELQPERDISYNPLFQVMFSLQNVPRSEVDLRGLRTSPFHVESGTTHFDLTVHMSEQQGSLIGNFAYNVDLFGASTVERMLGHYQTLLEGIVADPDQRIAELPLLTRAARHQILVTWNDTTTISSPSPCLHHLFERQAARTPDVVAVVAEDQQLTYHQLNQRANQVAYRLQELGVEPETTVGLYMHRTAEMIIGLLGILKAGGAFVPLDPATPQARLRVLTEDAGIQVVLTTARHLPEWPADGPPVVCLDAGQWSAYPTDPNPVPDVVEENAVYVLYTSGSTGIPKGVVVEHRQLSSYVCAAVDQYGMAEGGTFAMVQPLSVDSCQTMIFPALGWGGTLHLISRERALDAAALSSYFQHHPADFLKISPAHLSALLIGTEPGELLPRSCLIIGGEVFHWDLADRLLALEPPCDIWNHYGPTETTVGVLTYPVSNAVTAHRSMAASVPLGRPLPGTRIYILDRHGNPVPIGVPGELCVGGPFVARGYLNRPEQTAALFIEDHFSSDSDGRLYRTGDLTRYLPDGMVEFLGRSDDQVKIRGYRVELEEIEAVMGQHPATLDVVVQVRDDVRGDKKLVAYVVAEGDGDVDFTELRGFLLEKLPEYMVPSTFVMLDTLPRTPHGKVDRRALPAPDWSSRERAHVFVTPRTPVERTLAGIWAELLDLEQVGIHDNFFDLGGHSLLAVRLIAHVNRAFGTDLPVMALFQAPTIEQLAILFGRHEAEKTGEFSSLVNIQPGGSKPPLFVVPGNLGNVFTDLGLMARYLGPDQPVYGFQDSLQNPSRIKAVAKRYLEEIRRAKHEGPYLLAGVCWGCTVAFEMAQQLRTQGEDVSLLAMVEPDPPHDPGLRTAMRFMSSLSRRLRRRGGHHMQRMTQLSSAEQGEYARLKLKVAVNSWAVRSYVARPYPGRVELFLSEASLSRPESRQLAWRDIAAGGAQVHELPGRHAELVGDPEVPINEAHMQVLAEKMAACIDKALSDG